MPANILDVDTSFPEIRGKRQDEINREVLDHLFLLQEQLRYTLANLGQENFNETELDGIVTMIQEPVYMRLKDDEGNLAALSVTADGLLGSVSDLNGNITALTATVMGMRLEVSNGYSSATVTLTANGTAISSEVISFTGLVTFEALAGSGTTTINGDNIKTGTVKAIDIEGCEFTTVLRADGSISGRLNFSYLDAQDVAGGIRLDDQGAGTENEGKYRLFIYTGTVNGETFHLKLAPAGKLSIETRELIYIWSGTLINLTGETEVTGNLTVSGGAAIQGSVTVNGRPLETVIADVVEEKLAEAAQQGQEGGA